MTKEVAVKEQAPIVGETEAMLDMIRDAASNPDIDVNKLERLMTLRDRVASERKEQAFSEAMNTVQDAIKPIATDANNPQTSSKYASYSALDNALRPIYIANGFEVSFDTDVSPKGVDWIRVVCTIGHKAGHKRQSKTDLPITTTGPKGNPLMTPMHATGSAIQYGKRYTLGMAFNIAVARDDDGNGAGAVQITEDEAKAFHKLVDDLEGDEAKLCAFVGADSVEEMTQAQLKKATTGVNAWARSKRAKQKETA